MTITNLIKFALGGLVWTEGKGGAFERTTFHLPGGKKVWVEPRPDTLKIAYDNGKVEHRTSDGCTSFVWMGDRLANFGSRRNHLVRQFELGRLSIKVARHDPRVYEPGICAVAN